MARVSIGIIFMVVTVLMATGTISRDGLHHVTIKDTDMIVKLEQMDVKEIDGALPRRFLALSGFYLDGYEIPCGTLIAADRS